MPTPAGILAPLLLVGVLLSSAVAKAKEPISTQSAITLLRLPRILQNRTIAVALPIGEGVLALAMLAPWSPLVKLAAAAAGLLFLAYAVIVARALTFDPRPSCGCFGRIGDQRIVPKTLVRNLFLVVAAGVFLWFAVAGHTVPEVLLRLEATGWAWLGMSILVAGVAVLVLGGGGPRTAHPSHPTPMTPVEAPGATSEMDVEDDEDYIRSPIPQALLLDPEGSPHTLQEMAVARAQLLVFVNCYCGSTHQAFRSVQRWRDSIPQIDVRMIFSGVPVMAPVGDVDTEGSWLDHGALTWQKLALSHSPSAVLLGADGWLAGGPVGGTEELDDFLAEIGAALADVPVPEPALVPEPAPESSPTETQSAKPQFAEAASLEVGSDEVAELR